MEVTKKLEMIEKRKESALRVQVERALRRMNRYREILGVLVRYGFYDVARKFDVKVGLRSKRFQRQKRTWTKPERMRRALEELGPTFVKIGQLLSHRPDILPSDWIAEFEKLRGRVPPVNSEGIAEVVEQELGAPPKAVFQNFSSSPIASASIAQVHRAQLKLKLPTGTARTVDVAVKIQRPGIRRTIEIDLSIIRDMARISERTNASIAQFKPVEAIRELEYALLQELDFRNEADNLRCFRRNFEDNPLISVPEPLPHYSSRRVLTMNFIDGIPVGDCLEIDSESIHKPSIARLVAETVLRQIFEHGFFHSDPHGGNILIIPGNKIAFLDFGQVGTILPSQRIFLADLLAAIINSDASRAVRAVSRWSGYREPEIIRRFTIDMELLIQRYITRPFGRIEISEMVSAIISLIKHYEIKIPSNFYLLAKALLTIENIASSLEPSFNFKQVSTPFVRKMIAKELSPKRIAEKMVQTSNDTLRLIQNLPAEAHDILSLIKEGKIRTEIEIKDTRILITTLRKVATRLSASVLLAAMIMGSSILVQSLIPPLIFGIPAIGIIGFIFSGLIGILFLVDLWRNR